VPKYVNGKKWRERKNSHPTQSETHKRSSTFEDTRSDRLHRRIKAPETLGFGLVTQEKGSKERGRPNNRSRKITAAIGARKESQNRALGKIHSLEKVFRKGSQLVRPPVQNFEERHEKKTIKNISNSRNLTQKEK